MDIIIRREISLNGHIYFPDKLLKVLEYGQIYEGRRQYYGKSEYYPLKRTIKVISRENIEKYQLRQSLLHQHQLLVPLSHSNVHTYHEIQFDDENWYFISDKQFYSLQQHTLRRNQHRYSPFNQENIYIVANSVFHGLKHLHSLNYAYCNLTPSTILFFKETIKISGLQYVYNMKSDKQNNLKKPPKSKYYPHNQQVNPAKADLFSFGVILLEMIISTKQCTEQLVANLADVEKILKQSKLEGKEIKSNLIQLILKSLDLSNQFTIEDVENSEYMKEIRPRPKYPSKQSQIVPIKGSAKFIKFCQQGFQDTIKSKLILDQGSQMIRCPITYKQALGLINYCRIAAYIFEKQQQIILKKQIGQIVLEILSNILQKLNNGIIYQDERYKQTQSNRLKTICEQYIQKYAASLNCRQILFVQGENLSILWDILHQHIITLSLSKNLFDYCTQFKFIFLSYWLGLCYDKKDYSIFGKIDEKDFKDRIQFADYGHYRKCWYKEQVEKFLNLYPETDRERLNLFFQGLHI